MSSERITGAWVNWNADWANPPGLVLRAELPRWEEYLFDRREGVWFGECDGFVQVLAGDPDRPGGGYGGSTFTLNLRGGGTVKLVGPYSGCLPGVTSESVYHGCYLSYAASVRNDLYREAVRRHLPALKVVGSDDSPYGLAVAPRRSSSDVGKGLMKFAGGLVRLLHPLREDETVLEFLREMSRDPRRARDVAGVMCDWLAQERGLDGLADAARRCVLETVGV